MIDEHILDTAHEINFDGIAGPTHNYGGLAYGNTASMKSEASVSNPREALLQCLKKMDLLASLGLKQAVLPPQNRPDFHMLHRLGYSGSERKILEDLAENDLRLLAGCYSSSNMWAANAATVSPRADTSDGRTHFTPANLINLFHRSLEPPFTSRILRRIFNDESKFTHHMPLPESLNYSDEGAANHTRFCPSYGSTGIEFFVYGSKNFEEGDGRPLTFPARQTFEASSAVARLHKLDPEKTVFARQNPEVIDAGVFHNDVISVGNRNVLFFHSQAFCNSDSILSELKRKFAQNCQDDLILIEVSPEQLSLAEAVESYLFNSQLVSMLDGTACLIAPAECRKNLRVKEVLDMVVSQDNPIGDVLFVDVRESMKNGGGPACLRLRVVLTDEELSHTHQGIFLSKQLYKELVDWGKRHYRDRLRLEDLGDPQLLYESRNALDSLTQVLGLGSIYDFQQP
ncbi:MAG: N-succinylarginine dihydrolase [Desulfomonilaceae bacterium]